MNRYYLVEDYDPAVTYVDGTVISLTPQASYQFTRQGIPYHPLEEFYDEKALREGEGKFFREELEWFDAFDRYLRDTIGSCRAEGIGPARAYYNLLKYFVNSVIIQSRILKALVQSVETGSTLVFVQRIQAFSAKRTIRGFRFSESSSCFGELLPLVVQERNELSLVFHRFGAAGQEPPRHLRSPSLGKQVKAWLKEKFQPFWLFLRYGRPGKGKARGDRKDARVLFLHSRSPYLDPVIRQFVREGAKVWIRQEDGVLPLRPWWGGFSLQGDALSRDEEARLRGDCREASSRLGTRGRFLLEWIDRQAEADVSSFVLPYLQAFIQDTVPRLILRMREYEHLLRSGRISHLLTHTSSDGDSKSALLAAKKVRGVRTVGIQHGCQIFADDVWLLTDIDAFDAYLASDSLSQQKFQAATSLDFVSPCRVLQSSHYLKRFQPSRNGRLSASRHPMRKVLYLPSKLPAHARRFNWINYPFTWYFEFQKALLEFFGRRPDYHFVYKQADHRKHYAWESMIPYLSDRRFSNVSLDTRRTWEAFRGAEAVMMDRPTTSFFEAVATGLPVLAFYPQWVDSLVRREDKSYFGKSLQSFSCFEEAFQIIDGFLKGDPKDYIHPLPLSEENPVSLLLKQAPGDLHARG